MSGSLLIRGGLVVSSTGIAAADVRIQSGVVAEIGTGLKPDGEVVIDADGLHVLPGVIDAHTHQWEPGFMSPPDFSDVTASAAAGGITTIIDHPLTRPEVVDAKIFRDKVELGERTSCVDFALYAGVNPGHLEAMEELWAAGAAGFKFFTCDSGSALQPFLNPRDQKELLLRIRALDAIALVHAEDQAILDESRSLLEATGRDGLEAFFHWRSPIAEKAAVDAILQLALEYGSCVYFAHVSLPEAVAEIAAAHAGGAAVYAETCPHYLCLTQEELFAEGRWATSAPPVRDRARRNGLRGQLANEISAVGSDHCSAPAGDRDAFSSVHGLPGNETMLPLLLDLVAQGALKLERLVALVCEAPARLFGLSPHKGFLRPRADGDVTLVDTRLITVPDAKQMVGSAGWTPYEGRRLRGRAVRTIVRGTTVAVDGKPVAAPGFGRFIRRTGSPLDLHRMVARG
jgi:dihydroorotase (multifunctional complex type)